MTPVLLDTGVIVALLDRSERNHTRCVEVIESLVDPLVTCEAVIAEACYLLRDVHGAPDAVLDNVEAGVFEIPFRLVGASRSIRLLAPRRLTCCNSYASAQLSAMPMSTSSGTLSW